MVLQVAEAPAEGSLRERLRGDEGDSRVLLAGGDKRGRNRLTCPEREREVARPHDHGLDRQTGPTEQRDGSIGLKSGGVGPRDAHGGERLAVMDDREPGEGVVDAPKQHRARVEGLRDDAGLPARGLLVKHGPHNGRAVPADPCVRGEQEAPARLRGRAGLDSHDPVSAEQRIEVVLAPGDGQRTCGIATICRKARSLSAASPRRTWSLAVLTVPGLRPLAST